MQNFKKSKMATAAILDFQNFAFLIMSICKWYFYIFLCNLAIIGQRMQKWHRDIQCCYLHWKCLTAPLYGHFLGQNTPKFQKFKITTPKRHLLAQFRVVWAFSRENRSTGMAEAWSREKKKRKKRKKVTVPVYNTTAWGSYRLSYRDHTLQFWLTLWHNHSHLFCKQSVKNVGWAEGWNLVF